MPSSAPLTKEIHARRMRTPRHRRGHLETR